ncbi:head-tail connector protein, partial [bacterium]|nr:head-tail connector protein [bacterium]
WLQDVQEKMSAIFQKSNTYSVLTSMYTELGAFGTACAIVEEDFNTVIHLTNYTIGEYFLSRDRRGRINGFYRRFYMTAGQMVDEFGLGNVSQAIQIDWQQNNPDKWHVVNHLIETNDDRIPFMKDYKNMAYRTVYWQDNENDKYLRLGGYEELPILGPRFEFTTSHDVYGKGSGWKALGSIKELQKKVKDELIGIEKGNNPPLQKESSVVGEVNTLPGGITTSSSNLPHTGVRAAYDVKLNIADLDVSIEKTKQKIKKFFFADLFLMMIEAERKGSPITATEIVEKANERISKIGPVLELWQGDEFIKSAIDRTFAICLRNGMFPEPPEEIADIEIKVQYTSILAQAQKMVDIQAIDIWTAGVLQDAGVVDNVIDLIDFDEKNRHKAEMLGIPPKIINSITKVANIRREKAKQIEETEAQNRTQALAEAAAKGGKAVKDMATAPMGQDSALDRTLDAVKEINQ